MHFVTSAIVLAARQSVAQQSSAECLAEAATMEASLLQARSAFERQSVGGAKAEDLVGAEGAVEIAAERAAEQRQPAQAQAEAEEVGAAPVDARAMIAEAGSSPGEEAIVGGDAAITKIEPFGREDTATELQRHAAKTQDTLIDAVENAEVAEIKRSVFRALTRLRAAEIKEFDTIARLETQAIDEYNDEHHYRKENPLQYLHSGESEVAEDKYSSFHD